MNRLKMSSDILTPMASNLAGLLKSRDETIAVAESSTGGLISAALLAIPGASAYFLGGGVIYTREARRNLLGLADEVVTMRGATEDYALIVARKIREQLGSTWGFSETGASGPAGNRYGDAPGHTCFALAGPRDQSMTLETGLADREENMWRFAAEGLAFMENILAKDD
jgi:nicotinamide-nucleotide amidase